MSEAGSGTSSFCGGCGHPVRAGERFCGNCGRAVAQGEERTSAAAGSPMLFVGVAMIAVALVAIASVVFFGDRLGLAGNDPEPARLLEPTDPESATGERDEPDDGATSGPDDPSPDPPEASQSPGADGTESFEQEFVAAYYDAVAREDWSGTYALLDAASQAEFTEGEWNAVQEARVAANEPAPLASATLQSATGEGAGFVGDVLLSYTDGTSETVPVRVVYEGGNLKRSLAPEDVAYLRDLVPEPDPSGEMYEAVATAVERFVYEYYAAVAAEDWSATYSMLDYNGQAAFMESEWTERQQTRQAVSGAPSSVVDVEVSVPEDYPVYPRALATVTFADGEVVEITVVDPHSLDGEFDRVLTAEEIAYLRSL